MTTGFSKLLQQGDTIKGGPWDGFEVIHTYTRAEAISDGVLVDVSEMAREAGILHPTAVTRAVWDNYIEVPDGLTLQDEQARLWDILYMFTVRARIIGGSEIKFNLSVRKYNRRAKLITLKAICGPGDNGDPVITIMLPDED